jgi:hypothetical protein
MESRLLFDDGVEKGGVDALRPGGVFDQRLRHGFVERVTVGFGGIAASGIESGAGFDADAAPRF